MVEEALELSSSMSCAPRKLSICSRVSLLAPQATVRSTMSSDAGDTTTFLALPSLSWSRIVAMATRIEKSIVRNCSSPRLQMRLQIKQWR
ncbi:hypothetical protein LINPERPRIM_LOCUS40072 [Linum perenne]